MSVCQKNKISEKEFKCKERWEGIGFSAKKLVMNQRCMTQWMADIQSSFPYGDAPYGNGEAGEKKSHLRTPRFHTVFVTIWGLTYICL